MEEEINVYATKFWCGSVIQSLRVLLSWTMWSCFWYDPWCLWSVWWLTREIWRWSVGVCYVCG